MRTCPKKEAQFEISSRNVRREAAGTNQGGAKRRIVSLLKPFGGFT
jgi:hypothetical protein